jgi:predicted dehydrogenase
MQSTAVLAAQGRSMANENIQIALLGAGGMGQGDVRYAVSLPGVKLVAAADVYDGRLERVKEVWGKDVFTTRDYREVLARKDVDAVIVATPDHWHARITIEALEAGKDVYCEKPMVHSIDEGRPVIEAQRKSGKILQVGSQYASGLIFEKAREVVGSGALGELNMVEAWLDRNSALGAWQYSIPPGVSQANVDWDRFLGKAPKRAFEPARLFRWRNYEDYGTGVAGDLFVHLLTGLHVVTGSLGPSLVYASGGLRFWQDGRDAFDVVLATMEYPKTGVHPDFTLALRVNLASGGERESFGLRFVGSEGTMAATTSSLTVARTPRDAEPGYTIGTFAKAAQEEFLKEYHRKYPKGLATTRGMQAAKTEVLTPPPGHNMHLEHHRNFYAAVRSRKPFFEDGVFGFRAAGPALLANVSMRERRAVKWDAAGMAEA